MRVLIVDDDFVSRVLLHEMLSAYGGCDIAVDEAKGVGAFDLDWNEGKPHELICMDVMMPGMDGQEALRRTRRREKDKVNRLHA